MRKRSNGEGTIYRRKDGSWCAQLTVNINGKIKRKTVYGKTQKIVKEKLRGIQDAEAECAEEENQYTLVKWIIVWLRDYKRKNLKVTTYENYCLNVEKHIEETEVGNTPIDQLTANQLQNFYNRLSENGRKDGKGGLSPTTVKYIHILISGALEQAVKNDMLVKNVSKATELPQKKHFEIVPLSIEEVKTFMEICKTDRLYALYLLEIYSGLRRGEILGLEWTDIDFEEKKLYVRKTLVRVNDTDENAATKTKLTTHDPKTKKSKRTMPLNDIVIEGLKRHKEEQNREKIEYSDIYVDRNLVFARQDGDYLRPREFLRDYQKLLAKAGIERKRFHDLRHTFASILLNADENPKVIQELLGHSTISTTLDIYSHVMEETKVKTVKKLEDKLRN